MSTLDDIKARAENATEGPWQAGVGSTADDTELVTTREQKASYLADSLNDAESPLWLVDNGAVIPAATGDGPRAEANAEFIAHARTDVPKLVAALEAVQKMAQDVPRVVAFGGTKHSGILIADDILKTIDEALS